MNVNINEILQEFRIEDIEKKLYKIDESAKADENTEEKDNKIVELEKMLSYHKDVRYLLLVLSTKIIHYLFIKGDSNIILHFLPTNPFVHH